MKTNKPKYDSKEEFLALSQRVVNLFDFVKEFGYELLQEKWPTSNDFRDGFSVAYKSENSQIRIEYFDMQFDVYFYRGDQAISFYLIDELLFDRKSAFHGDMFPRDKLETAAQTISIQIQNDFSEIIRGEPMIWDKILNMDDASEKKKKLPG